MSESGRAIAVGVVQGRLVSKQSDTKVGSGKGRGGIGEFGVQGGGKRRDKIRFTSKMKNLNISLQDLTYTMFKLC